MSTPTEENTNASFNEAFCGLLEHRISQEFYRVKDSELKGYWCDGVSWALNQNELSKKYINDKRKIETRAWIGKNGQTAFKAILHFGRKALSNYARGVSLESTIPELGSDLEWIEIDTDNKTIEIKLL